MSFATLPYRLKLIWKLITNFKETCRVAYIRKTIPLLIDAAKSLDYLSQKELVTYPFKIADNCYLGGVFTHESARPNCRPIEVHLFQFDKFVKHATPDVYCKCTPMAIAYTSDTKNFIITNDLLVALSNRKEVVAQMLVKAIFAHELGHIENPSTIIVGDNPNYDCVLQGELLADTTLYYSGNDPKNLYYNVMVLGLYALNATMTPSTSKCALDRLYNLAYWIYTANLPIGATPMHAEGSDTEIGKKIYNMLLETTTDECFYPIKRSFSKNAAVEWHIGMVYLMQKYLKPDDLKIVEA